MEWRRMDYLFAGTIAFFVVLLITQVAFAESTFTTGTCLNSTHIQYTTTAVVNGQTYTIESAEIECTGGCMTDMDNYGDQCGNTRGVSMEMIALWSIVWALLIWMWGKWSWGVAPLMTVNAISGILIVQSFILLIPIILTSLLWMWKWGLIGKAKNWFR